MHTESSASFHEAGLSNGSFDELSFAHRSKFTPESPRSFSDAVELTLLKRLTPEQIEQVSSVYARCFSGPPWFEQWSQANARDEIIANLGKGAKILIAEKHGQVVGFSITYQLSQYQNREQYHELGASRRATYFAELAVLPEFGGQGLGGKLFRRTLEHAEKSGVSEVWTQTRTDNVAARKLFERNGFESAGTYEATTGEVPSERAIYKLKIEQKRCFLKRLLL